MDLLQHLSATKFNPEYQKQLPKIDVKKESMRLISQTEDHKELMPKSKNPVEEIGMEDRSNNMTLKTIVNNYEEKLNQIISDSDKFYLVNAGRMNHGKSSLLNSLTGKIDDFFEVQDKRTTVENKTYQYNENTYFIDTPGLNANDSDDQEAIKAYKKANLILFVHNLSVGDIRKEEVRDIKTIISCFNSIDNLANKFILVLTGKDAIQSKDDLNNIKSKVLLA